MSNIYPPSKVFIAKSKIHGYGVFAKEDLFPGDVIEVTPLIDVGFLLDRGHNNLINYVFKYPPKLKGKIEKLVLPLGYGCIYNHSDNPNADWRLSEDKEMFEFFCLSAIKINEEICTFYGPEYWESRNIKLKKSLI